MIQVQIQYKAVCISLSTNAFEKGMNPSVLPPTMGKYVDRLGYLASVRHAFPCLLFLFNDVTLIK